MEYKLYDDSLRFFNNGNRIEHILGKKIYYYEQKVNNKDRFVIVYYHVKKEEYVTKVLSRIIAKLYLDIPYEHWWVRYKDGNPLNYKLENLYVVSQQYTVQESYRSYPKKVCKLCRKNFKNHKSDDYCSDCNKIRYEHKRKRKREREQVQKRLDEFNSYDLSKVDSELLEILTLRRDGKNLDEIGRLLNYSRFTISRKIKNAPKKENIE